MSSPTNVSNMALGHLGSAKSIGSLDEQSVQAAACRTFFEPAVKATLRDFPWPFATRIVVLQLVAVRPSDEWGYSYQYPNDCLEFRRIPSGIRNDNRQSEAPYRIVNETSGRRIYTDFQGAQGEYTVYVKDVSQWPPDFTLAVSYRLAVYVAPQVTSGDPFKLRQQAEADYQMEITRAKVNAANEERPDPLPDSEFIRARTSGLGSRHYNRRGGC